MKTFLKIITVLPIIIEKIQDIYKACTSTKTIKEVVKAKKEKKK